MGGFFRSVTCAPTHFHTHSSFSFLPPCLFSPLSVYLVAFIWCYHFVPVCACGWMNGGGKEKDECVWKWGGREKVWLDSVVCCVCCGCVSPILSYLGVIHLPTLSRCYISLGLSDALAGPSGQTDRQTDERRAMFFNMCTRYKDATRSVARPVGGLGPVVCRFSMVCMWLCVQML